MLREAELLYESQNADDATILRLINLQDNSKEEAYLLSLAEKKREEYYGKDIYIRGLIELSNHCKNNCFYCGLRAANRFVGRYRLNKEQILQCTQIGYKLGFRTFVLQGGEDAFYTDEILCDIIKAIKSQHPDCALTLSIGEKSFESYRSYRQAGADRYLLRHETATKSHYEQLHPPQMSFENRLRCLQDLKKLGYQVGSGFMVSSPYQKPEHLLADLRFLQSLKPDMVGIGPFIPHHQTPFANFKSDNATLENEKKLHLTLRLLALTRLLLPKSLLPSTTALGSIHPEGRLLGLKAGANVVMPNLSPMNSRKLYSIYDNKAYTNAEAAEGLALLKSEVESTGFQISISRGDVLR